MIDGKNIRLAIVDDEHSMLRICEVAFGSMGYEVSVFADGVQFIKSIASGVMPDVVLLDVMMPSKSGFEICREIKSDPVYKKIKVIMYTALSGEAVRYQSEKAGADMCVTKGIDMEKISEIIKNLF